MDVLRAKDSFVAAGKRGASRVVSAGDLVPADDPVVKGREHLFETTEEYVARTHTPPAEQKNTVLRKAKPARRGVAAKSAAAKKG